MYLVLRSGEYVLTAWIKTKVETIKKEDYDHAIREIRINMYELLYQILERAFPHRTIKSQIYEVDRWEIWTEKQNLHDRISSEWDVYFSDSDVIMLVNHSTQKWTYLRKMDDHSWLEVMDPDRVYNFSNFLKNKET